MFCKKGVLRNFVKFIGKQQCQRPFFNKAAGLRPATLLKRGLWHRCFPVNFVIRTPFLTVHLKWLLLRLNISLKGVVYNFNMAVLISLWRNLMYPFIFSGVAPVIFFLLFLIASENCMKNGIN